MQEIGFGFLLLSLPHVLVSTSQEDKTISEEEFVSRFIPPMPDVDINLKYGKKGDSNHDDTDASKADASKVCSMGIKCGKDSGVRVELPVQGIMGAEGPQGEPGPPGVPGVPGPPGDSGRKDCDVAFYVGLAASHDFSYLTSNIPLVFDKVVTNRGNAYTESNGKFKAPHDGTYIFYVTVSAKEERKGAVSVLVNGTFLSSVWAESFNDWGSASNTYILDLVSGEEVWLSIVQKAHDLYGGMYTSFSGMCLWRKYPEV